VSEKPNATKRLGRCLKNPWVRLAILFVSPLLPELLKRLLAPMSLNINRFWFDTFFRSATVVLLALLVVALVRAIRSLRPHQSTATLSALGKEILAADKTFLAPCMRHRSRFSCRQVLQRIGGNAHWSSQLRSNLKRIEHNHGLFRQTMRRSSNASEMYDYWNMLTSDMHHLFGEMWRHNGQWNVCEERSGFIELQNQYHAFRRATQDAATKLRTLSGC
jgi:hypothetical protein